VATRRGLGLVLTILLLASRTAAAMVVLMLAVAGAGRPVQRCPGRARRRRSRRRRLRPCSHRSSARGGTARGPSWRTSQAKADRRSRRHREPVGLSSAYWAGCRRCATRSSTSSRPASRRGALEYGGDREYFVPPRAIGVPAADEPLDVSGFASYELFLRARSTRSRLPDFLHIGDFKTAPNSSPRRRSHRPIARWPSRSTGTCSNNSCRPLPAAAEDAGPGAPARDNGPFLAEDAVRAGLVDDVATTTRWTRKVRPAPRPACGQGRRVREVRAASVGLAAGPASPSSTPTA